MDKLGIFHANQTSMWIKGEVCTVKPVPAVHPVIFLLTIPWRCFFCGSILLFVFVILSCLFLVALLSAVGKGLTSWVSCI